ncbi:MAG: radical SAM protein, partial [Nanoarchaeota archaeon]
MDYIKFADEFYKKNILPLNSVGLKRTFRGFHLVDMYPSIKAMDNFTNKKKLIDVIKNDVLISDKVSLYIHFPFCKNFCSYCHLYKENIYKSKNSESDYIDSLIKEIAFYAKIFNKKIIAKSIYFGGGTPSLIGIDSLKHILKTLEDYFIINKDSFISFEVYPGSSLNEVDLREKLNILKDFGVKEIVLDLQSSNDKSLEDIGRGDTNFTSWKRLVKIVKNAGINGIKTSMIIGLPFDNIRTFLKSVNDITSIKEVSTISLFLLEFREGLRVFDDLMRNPNKFCTETERDKMQILVR